MRGRFLALVTQESIRGLICKLTLIPDAATWHERATSRRSWLEAGLTGNDEAEVPTATAKLMLPEPGISRAGTERNYAELTLHIDLVEPK